MAFKIKNIASRFVLQSVFTLLVLTVFLLLILFSNARKADTLKATQLSGLIKSDLGTINFSIDELFTLHNNAPDFGSQRANELMDKNRAIFNRLIASIEALDNYKFLNNYLYATQAIDSIKVIAKTARINSEKLILSLKELGNHNSGKTSQALIPLNLLANELFLAPDEAHQYTKLRNLLSAYLSEYSIESAIKLKNFCQEVSYNFYDYPDFDPGVIETHAFASSEALSDCINVLKRIENKTTKTGQLPDVISSINSLKQSSTQLLNDIELEVRSYLNWWNYVFIGVTVVFGLACLYLIMNFARIMKDNIKRVISNAKKVSAGVIDDKTDEKGIYEFSVVNKELGNIQSFLSERNSFVKNMLYNTFNGDLELKSSADLLSENLNALKDRMIKEQEERKKADEDYEKRRYLNEGLAKFADIMRSNSNDTTALGDNLIKELVKYLGALQGGIFLTNEENDEELNLIAAFAFDRKKYMTKTVRKGEGLIGTCALEKMTCNLTEIPGDYVAIKSGLGDTPPNNILIIPVMNEQHLVGVLELASLKVLAEFEIELAEQIATNLASTIITVRNNTKTVQLLEKSQQQAAEMREQEEEMRQNMEELKATQEESTRREEEMQGLIDAVEAGFYLIEYSTDGTIENINSQLADFLEQPFESIIGRTHLKVFSDESLINNDFFNELIKSKSTKKASEVLSWGSKKLIYKHTCSPILTKSGEVTKILNLLSIDEQDSESV